MGWVPTVAVVADELEDKDDTMCVVKEPCKGRNEVELQQFLVSTATF